MRRLLFLAVVALFTVQPAHAETVKINLHSCCVTEDATTKEILPAFKKYYKEKFGKDVDISASFAGSGTLKNQILGGAPVQVAVLSSELYLDQLKEKGPISSDWRKNPNKGAVSELIKFLYTADAQRSYAKFGFRPVDKKVEKEFHAKYAQVAEPFTVDDLGGWKSARKNVIENVWKKTQQR